MRRRSQTRRPRARRPQMRRSRAGHTVQGQKWGFPGYGSCEGIRYLAGFIGPNQMETGEFAIDTVKPSVPLKWKPVIFRYWTLSDDTPHSWYRLIGSLTAPSHVWCLLKFRITWQPRYWPVARMVDGLLWVRSGGLGPVVLEIPFCFEFVSCWLSGLVVSFACWIM